MSSTLKDCPYRIPADELCEIVSYFDCFLADLSFADEWSTLILYYSILYLSSIGRLSISSLAALPGLCIAPDARNTRFLIDFGERKGKNKVCLGSSVGSFLGRRNSRGFTMTVNTATFPRPVEFDQKAERRALYPAENAWVVCLP